MDKNNDIQVNKVSKWKEAPDSIKDLHSTINAIFVGLSFLIDPKKADDKNYALNNLLTRVLDDYNELEAKYQEACGMISQYEEENRILREQRNELVGDNGILRYERDRHIDLLDKLRWALEDRGIQVEWNEAALKWNLYDKTNTTCESCKHHFKEELRIRCKEIDDKNKLIEELTDENRVFRLKNLINRSYGLMGQIELLNKEIDELYQQIKDLESRNSRILKLHEKIKELEKENKRLEKKNEELENALNDKNKLLYKLTPEKSNVGNNKVPPIGCCGCCTVCTLKDICRVLND